MLTSLPNETLSKPSNSECSSSSWFSYTKMSISCWKFILVIFNLYTQYKKLKWLKYELHDFCTEPHCVFYHVFIYHFNCICKLCLCNHVHFCFFSDFYKLNIRIQLCGVKSIWILLWYYLFFLILLKWITITDINHIKHYSNKTVY